MTHSKNQFDRINVVGTSGSGKSTVSKLIAEKLGHPRIEIDQLFWEPNWTQPSDDTFFPKLRAALDTPRWVLDGNYDRTLHIKWENVTAVVWVDYSIGRTLFQAVKRAITRSMHGKELWPGTGNKESLRKSFLSKDSIILWTIKTYATNKARYEKRLNDPQYQHIRFIRLKSPSEIRKFIDSISSVK